MKIEAGSEALQQIAQSQEGLVDHVDIVDDGACTGEDAGNGVEHLTDIQEAVVSVAGHALDLKQDVLLLGHFGLLRCCRAPPQDVSYHTRI